MAEVQGVCTCPRAELCAGCFASALAHLSGVAARRGDAWAASVAARIGRGIPWPPYEGRCAEIARRKVADLTADPRLELALARRCAEHAARVWGAAPRVLPRAAVAAPLTG